MTQLKVTLIAGATLAAIGIAGATLAQGTPDGHGFVRLQQDEMKWVPYPADTGKLGLMEQMIIGDPAKPGPYVIRLKFPPGIMSTPHSHGEDRVGTVIKGTWWTGTSPDWDPSKTQPMHAGGVMLHPHGEVHYDGARDEEVIVQLAGMGPTSKSNVNPADPPFRKH